MVVFVFVYRGQTKRFRQGGSGRWRQERPACVAITIAALFATTVAVLIVIGSKGWMLVGASTQRACQLLRRRKTFQFAVDDNDGLGAVVSLPAQDVTMVEHVRR